MSRVFADSFYFFALTNRRDDRHAKAREWTNSFEGNLITTEWVMLEFADGLARSPGRSSFYALRQTVLADGKNLVLPFDMDLYEAGLELLRARSDKQWSLTDCISFIVMRREGLTDALTGDHDFEQAGFRTLLS